MQAMMTCASAQESRHVAIKFSICRENEVVAIVLILGDVKMQVHRITVFVSFRGMFSSYSA
jgi:hypothetical protein